MLTGLLDSMILAVFLNDHGCQFTSAAFTARLEAVGVRISMDGRGRVLTTSLPNDCGAW